MSSHSRPFTLDDGDTEVEVNFDITSWGCGDSWSSYGGDPGEPPEIEIGDVFLISGQTVTDQKFVLTPEGEARFTAEVCENIGDYDDGGFDG